MRFAALILLLFGTPALAKPVRVFVANTRVDLEYAVTYAAYRDKMFGLVETEIASHLRPNDPDAPPDVLIVFPEDVGLVAGLIGSRGATARARTLADGASSAAFIDLFLAYQPQIQFYTDRYPGLGGLGYLFLGATDTFYRAFYETFRDLATTYGVHVAASVNVAAARRIDAAEQPELVALLRDPDEATTRTYAYEATTGRPVNTLFVFAPDGQILVVNDAGETVRSPEQTDGVLSGSLDKAYLTQIEQSPLGLVSSAVRDLDVLDTPVGRLASVTSKDAWMIDVNDRYDAKRPQLIIQAEAFDSWGFVVDPWLPDGFKAGGFAQVQRNPSFLFNLTPCLVGNLFDVTFDGQGAVIGKRRKGVAPALRWIGQNPDTGFIAVAPWIVPDPAEQQPALTLAERRALLVQSGVALLPGSGVPCPTPNGPGACENGYRESVLRVDLDVPDGPTPARVPGPLTPTAFEPAQFPAPGEGEQRHPAIAAHGGRIYVAWQDTRGGFANIFLAGSLNDGASFAVQRVSGNPAGSVVEMRPAIALDRKRGDVFVVWQELCTARSDDCGRIKLARFDATLQKIGGDRRVDSGADDAGKWNPAVAVDAGGNPVVAWVDERDRSPGGLPLEHIYFSRGRHRGTTMSPSARVDRGEPVPEAVELDNKWAPTVAAARGAYVVAWTDFRNYQWDIFASRSRTGRRFERSRRVDDAGDVPERIHDHPSLAIDARGIVHAVWADRRLQETDTDIRYARSRTGGRSFSASLLVDGAERMLDPNVTTPSQQWHPVVAAAGDDVVVAWQDNRLGDNDIFFARSRDVGASFEADERVDDSGADPSNQYRPAIAVDPGAAVYVAWEDERFGPATIAVARRALR